MVILMSKSQQKSDVSFKESQINDMPFEKVRWFDLQEEIAIAIKKDNVDFIRTVIDKKTQIDNNAFHEYFLLKACKYDAVEIFKYLSEERQGGNESVWSTGRTGSCEAIYTLISNYSFKILTAITEKMSPHDQEKLGSPTNKKWITLGKAAIIEDNLKVLEFLFEKGLVIKKSHYSAKDATFILTASGLDNTKIAEYLIKQGADINDEARSSNFIGMACAVNN
jgi:hypothetical protein